MANHELQLHEVSDPERFRIIEFYKEHPILWCREMTANRDKTTKAWSQIAENISTPDRTFPIPLIQKIVKNLRDQHTRLLKRGGSSSWKFLESLSFLGNELPSTTKKMNKSSGKLNNVKPLKKPKKLESTEGPISFVRVEENPLPIETTSLEQFIKPLNTISNLTDFQSSIEPIIQSSSNKQILPTFKSNTNQASCSTSNVEVQLNQVTDNDRLKIIEHYRKRPVLWDKNINGQRDKVCEAWQFVIDGVSTPQRQFDLPLVQKIAKNLKDQYVRIQRRGRSNSNWKYLHLLSFLDSNSTVGSKKSANSHKIKSNAQKKTDIDLTKKPTTSLDSSSKSPSLDASNPFWANLSLLSLAMPIMQNMNQNSNTQTMPLTSENLAAMQLDKSLTNNIEAWSMLVGSYMNNRRD